VGVTTVMINIGVQLATQDKSALLLELRSTRGTVGHNLALSPAEDLGGLLIRSPADIRPADVTRRVVRHRSGIKVLTGPSSAADYAISEAHVHIILEALMSQADYVLLDLPSVSAGGIQLALEQADQIMLVLEPETISVNCARADLEILKAWGVFDRTSLMIVSRARSSNLIAPKDIEKELGIDVIGALPPSPEVFYLAANLANPVVLSKPDSLAATTLVKLTRTLEEQLPVASPVRVR
jgi:pilus assembly protein CpaE